MALLEVQFLESEVSLHNASGLDSSSQHILLGGDVICFSYPLQIIQVTETQRERERGEGEREGGERFQLDFQPAREREKHKQAADTHTCTYTVGR